MSATNDPDILVRRVPDWFDSSKHHVSGNNIYEKGKAGARGQIEQVVGRGRPENLAGLCGGKARFEFLNAAGSVASILNLGVSVVGFMHVSKLLKRVEDRLDGVEAKLDDLTALAGVIDHKVDQLVEMNEAQTVALADVHGLVVSFELARVHAALETLDILSRAPKTPDRDLRIRDAVEPLQVFRNWLSDKRDSTDDSSAAIPARTELLRAEVAVTLAECRARCFVGDASFAGSVLDRAIAGGRTEVERMYGEIETHCLVSERHDSVELETAPFDTVDAVEALAWLKGISLVDAAVELATDMRVFADNAALRLQWTQAKLQVREAMAFIERASSEMRENLERSGLLSDSELADLFSDVGEVEETADEEDGLEEGFDSGMDQASKAAAAGFVASHRLVRDLEDARAMCAAMELGGERILALLADGRPASTPALVLDWSGADPKAHH